MTRFSSLATNLQYGAEENRASFLATERIDPVSLCRSTGHHFYARIPRRSFLRTWGPVLESPVNFSGPKSNIQIEMKRIRARVLASRLLQSCLDNVYCFFITIFRLAIPAFFRFTDVTEFVIGITILYLDGECRNKNCLKERGRNDVQHKKKRKTYKDID